LQTIKAIVIVTIVIGMVSEIKEQSGNLQEVLLFSIGKGGEGGRGEGEREREGGRGEARLYATTRLFLCGFYL